MSEIEIYSASYDYKIGFKVALKMILKWCESDNYKTVNDIASSIHAGLMLDELIYGDKNNDRRTNK